MGLFDRLQSELEGREKAAGLTMADVLGLPEPERQMVNLMMRRGVVTLAEAASRAGQSETSARSMLSDLIDQGFVREVVISGEARFQTRLAARRARRIPLNVWDALGGRLENPKP
jgi:hypothetical protein